MVRVMAPAYDILHDLLHGGSEEELADLDDEEEQHAHSEDKAAEPLGGRNISWQIGVLQQRRGLVGFILVVVFDVATMRVGLDVGAHARGLGVCPLGAVPCHGFVWLLKLGTVERSLVMMGNKDLNERHRRAFRGENALGIGEKGGDEINSRPSTEYRLKMTTPYGRHVDGVRSIATQLKGFR